VLERSTAQVLERLSGNDLVLDVGGWARPFARADWVIDLLPYDTALCGSARLCLGCGNREMAARQSRKNALSRRPRRLAATQGAGLSGRASRYRCLAGRARQSRQSYARVFLPSVQTITGDTASSLSTASPNRASQGNDGGSKRLIDRNRIGNRFWELESFCRCVPKSGGLIGARISASIDMTGTFRDQRPLDQCQVSTSQSSRGISLGADNVGSMVGRTV